MVSFQMPLIFSAFTALRELFAEDKVAEVSNLERNEQCFAAGSGTIANDTLATFTPQYT